MKDFIQFDKANEYVVNKDVVLNHYIKYMLARTQSMFSYSGLPDTLPASKLEMLLQTKGYAFITKVNDNLYAFTGTLTGEPDVYEDYTEIAVTNVALKLSKTYNLETDGVLINNDTLRIGLLPILNKYGALLAENTITIRTVDMMLRMVCMISASDDRTYTGAEKFIKDIVNGKLSAIGESAFFDGIKVHTVANTQNYLLQFMELEQYLKASCYNEIGLNANYNMKREQLGSNEAALNDDFLLPLVDNMIKERQIAVEKINEMFGTDIQVEFNSSWDYRLYNGENIDTLEEDNIHDEEVETTCEDVAGNEEPSVEPTDEPTLEPTETNNETSEESAGDENVNDETSEDGGTDAQSDDAEEVSKQSEEQPNAQQSDEQSEKEEPDEPVDEEPVNEETPDAEQEEESEEKEDEK